MVAHVLSSLLQLSTGTWFCAFIRSISRHFSPSISHSQSVKSDSKNVFIFSSLVAIRPIILHSRLQGINHKVTVAAATGNTGSTYSRAAHICDNLSERCLCKHSLSYTLTLGWTHKQLFPPQGAVCPPVFCLWHHVSGTARKECNPQTQLGALTTAPGSQLFICGRYTYIFRKVFQSL